jgi:hypothetical protein
MVACAFSSSLFAALTFAQVNMDASQSYAAIRQESMEKLQAAAREIGIDLASPDMEREFAINLLYGLQSATPYLEGQSMAGMMLQTVGGSSGGKLDFINSNVISHLGSGPLGVFGLFRLKEAFGFSMDRVSCFNLLEGKELHVSKISAPRHILEFNGKPAVTEYCRLLDIAPGEISPDTFARFTLGIDPGDNERLITSIMDMDADKQGFLVYNDVLPGTTFNLYESIDQTSDRAVAYRQLARKNLLAFLSFDCILCYLARPTGKEREDLSRVYTETMAKIPKIGFGTFSENISGANINQTETFLAIYQK